MTRRLPILLLLGCLCLALTAFAVNNTTVGELQHRNQNPEVQRATGVTPHHTGRTLDENIYYENWESGTLDGWTSLDLNGLPSTWHIDNFNPFGGTGTSWWVGDRSHFNGYNDNEYFVLDSPPIQLPATAAGLIFWHRYACEPYYNGAPPAGYNAWDGMNLRISTNGGATWTVVPGSALTPTYDRTSLYSFGDNHHEGTNIPGWCDSIATDRVWHLETANLSQWAGQTVKLRWAFASDEGYSSADNHNLFGWEIDNIRVYHTGATDTVFTDDCNAVGNWTTTNVTVGSGGALWRIATDTESPAGPHIVVCNNSSSNLYNPNMNTVLESPFMDTRNHGNGTLIADVKCTGANLCDSFPSRCDYWGMQVSIDSGNTWCEVSDPTCDPNGTPYVYSDFPPTWASFDSSYSVPMDFSALLGNVIKFRFTFRTDTANTVAFGPKFDGFTLDYSAGFPNDVTCYTLQVRYPTVASRPFRVKAYYQNVGQNDANSVPAFWRVFAAGQTNHAFLPLNLVAGARAKPLANGTLATANTYTIKAWSQLSTDQNLSNDTATVANVVVQPVGSEPEIGYDNRSVTFRFNYQVGHGPLVKFTPQSNAQGDSVVLGPYHVTSLLAQYDFGQPGDQPIRYHVYSDNGGVPGTSLYQQDITVTQADLGPNTWKVVDTHSENALHNLTGPFWVWLETTTTVNDTTWPAVLGDNSQPWDDVHHYTWAGSGAPAAGNFFYQIHATVVQANAVADHTGIVPTQWSLEQNFPNPFNPTTDIRYSVPRAERVTLKIYNLMGQEVTTLVDEHTAPGSYTVHFDASSLSSGVYIYRLESASFSASHKMLLMK